MPDHVLLVLQIQPKYSVSHTVGFLKGKSAILIHRHLTDRNRGFTGKHFWSIGYFESTVGLVEQMVK
jgi:putative transposase